MSLVLSISATNLMHDVSSGVARSYQFTDECLECEERQRTRHNTLIPHDSLITCGTCNIAVYRERPLRPPAPRKPLQPALF